MFKKKKFIFTIFIINFSLFSNSTNIKNMINYTINFLYSPTQNNVTEKPFITIYIHGTLPPLANQLFNGFFYAKQGLHAAKSYEKKYRVYKIAKTLSAADSKNYNIESTYIFGWSGKLDYTERKNAAIQLYQEIKKLLLKTKINKPNIRIITHSHGGNVALNLATINNDQLFVVQDLILLCCPVQKETSHLIENKMFTNIYSFFSNLDLIQILDPQGLNEIKKQWENNKKLNFTDVSLFSKRQFNSQKKTVQSHVKINGRSILHSEFIRTKFIKNVPEIIDTIKRWKIEQKIFNLPSINYFEFNIKD